VATVTIVDEQPAEVFRQLYLREKPMRFKAAPEKAAPVDAPVPEEEDGALTLDFAPYDAASLDERHTDDWLQTAAAPEALDRSLRRLDEQARLSLEEQGVNPLFLALGMLHYTEPADAAQVFKAPLLLLPVELTRKSARAGFSLRVTADDPLVNPALSETLRRGFGIQLPELPDSSAIPEDYDLQTFLRGAGEAVAAQKGWSVKTDIALALFSFQKLVMYKDLETHGPEVRRHRLLRQLVIRDEPKPFGLPADVETMDLDREHPPEATFQVVDADASQLKVIAACARGHDLVIEGPPGTGKSQTITNLIAQALGAGQSVLFVAEKMAALQVVHSRISSIGLGEFCLELHSSKANKRQVMKEIAAAIDASLHPVAAPLVSTRRLPQVRAGLSDYVAAVHAPYGVLSLSPYQAYGELGTVLGAPRWTWSGPPADSVSREQLDETLRQLRELAAVAGEAGPPAAHPWRDTTRTFYSPHDLETVQESGEDLARRLAEVSRRAAEAGESLDREIRTFSDIRTMAAVAEVLARSPGAPIEVLTSDAWNEPPREALALIERAAGLRQLAAAVGERFTPAVLEQEHADDIAYVERKSQGIFSFLAFLDARHRAVKTRWLACQLPAYQGSLAEQAHDMKKVDRLRREREELVQAEPAARALFGALWHGEASEEAVLASYVRWVSEVRGLCLRHGLSRRMLERAVPARPDFSDVQALSAAAAAAEQALDAFRRLVGWPFDLLSQASVGEIAERAGGILGHLTLGPQWAAFAGACQDAASGLARELLARGMQGEIPFAELALAFRRAFWMEWLSGAVRSRPPLAAFHTMTHEERIAEFRALDEKVLQENRAALVSRLRDQTQLRLRQPEAAAALPFLKREMARQRGLSPLRRTMRQAGAAIRAIKPCFLMSPLTVAQYLEDPELAFDLVIFDEASQLPTEDAVGSVLRGRQTVVVGDPKQLPPTSFFASSLSDVVPVDEDGTPLYEDSESILEELQGAGLHGDRLKWHYRSAHESLIHFSNVSFYDAGLSTFPSVETGSGGLGLHFEYVPDGLYEGKGLNLVEARRVADEVVRFAHEQVARRARGERPLSLGVGTFNLRQQLAIQDELELRRRNDPSLEPFFDRGVAEPFFVKNLENIQGDERDVIFLSVTYGRGPEGKIRYNFGPLNGPNGWRRLNVLTTRARHHMRVFSSMRGDEISPAATSSAGPRLLRDFLLYAERGRLDSAEVRPAADTETSFEREVFNELTRQGVRLVPQVGIAGYRIDFGVLDESLPGRFVCGLECDGAAYSGSETACDRDRLRQQVLESRGWTLFRVWSTDWFKDRAGQIERLLRLIEQARTRTQEELEAERQARQRATEEAAVREAEAAEKSRQEAAAKPGGTESRTYERPVAPPYVVTPGEGRYAGRDILEAPLSQLVSAVIEVVEHEGPVHATDLFARVAGMWGARVAKKVQIRLQEAAAAAEHGNDILRRGDFYFHRDGKSLVRSRSGVSIPAPRIAPEEYAEAILAVLGTGFGFSHPQLVQEARSVLGFNRTGAQLEEAISAAIESLQAAGRLGESSSGIRLRPSC